MLFSLSRFILIRPLQMMVKNNIGSLVVVSGGNKVESVVSERDYLEKVIVRGRTSANTQVKDIMSEKSLVTVRPESTLTECMELMSANKVRHIPVVATDGTPVGIVSIGDTVKALVNSYKRDAEHMENFIAGNTY
jgi:CBS domain-containing protein